MGAAAPVIGQVIVGYIVGKISTKIAQKIGFSDDVAGLIGIGAGMYAGSQVGGAPTPGTGSTEASLTAATNTPTPELPGALNTPAPTGNPVNPSPTQGPSGMLNQGAAPQGMLSQSQLPAAPPAPPPAPTTVAPPKEPASWWSRLFTPEKTMDLAMAGLSGYGKAGIAKEQMEYDDKMKQKNATAWTNYRGSPGGGLPQLSPNFPSQPAG